LCSRLEAVFDTVRHIATLQWGQPLTFDTGASHPVVERVARELPDLYRQAVDSLECIDQARDVELGLGAFATALKPADLVEQILERHRTVQAAKDKREWFEPYGKGFVIRAAYRKSEPVEIQDSLIPHPVRVHPLRQFMEDTRP
jgi:hypothetical protein